MRKDTQREQRARTANSLRRAESLSPDDRLMHRAVIRREKRAREIIAAWEGRIAWADRIVTVEALDA